MKILPEKEEFLKNRVRDVIALNPLVSIRRMQEILENRTGRSISDKYAAKLMHKVRRQAIIQSDRKKINERLSEIRERNRVLMEDLTRTIYWKPEFSKLYGLSFPSFKERLAAMKLLTQIESTLFRTELAAGVFEDRRAAIEEILRQKAIPIELQEKFIGVFRTWKLTSACEKDVQAPALSVAPNTDTA